MLYRLLAFPDITKDKAPMYVTRTVSDIQKEVQLTVN
jgi:hypothetical protein